MVIVEVDMPILSCEGTPSDPDDDQECDKTTTACNANSHVCEILCMYREDWLKVNDVLRQVVRLDRTYADAEKMFVTIGNAGVGVTDEGRKTPRVIQQIVKEVESDLGGNTDDALQLLGGSMTSMADSERAKVEIKRQEYGIKIIDRKLAANGCAPCKRSGAPPKR